jgi:hypothetical protein
MDKFIRDVARIGRIPESRVREILAAAEAAVRKRQTLKAEE